MVSSDTSSISSPNIVPAAVVIYKPIHTNNKNTQQQICCQQIGTRHNIPGPDKSHTLKTTPTKWIMPTKLPHPPYHSWSIWVCCLSEGTISSSSPACHRNKSKRDGRRRNTVKIIHGQKNSYHPAILQHNLCKDNFFSGCYMIQLLWWITG